MADNHEIGDFALSLNNLNKIRAGKSVTIMFRTPGMLVGKIGHHHGSFDIREVKGRLVTSNMAEFKRYRELRRAIEGAK